MLMNETQKDVLQEVANMGVGSASIQLSELLNNEVVMGLPNVEILDHGLTSTMISSNPDEKMGVVVQDLTGGMNGKAHFALISNESSLLVSSFLDSSPLVNDGDVDTGFYEQEALEEIGNIVISSCISEFADQLGNEVGLGIPYFIEGSFSDIFCEEKGAKQTALVIKTMMSVAEKNIKGMIIIMLTMKSTESLLSSINKLIESMEEEIND